MRRVGRRGDEQQQQQPPPPPLSSQEFNWNVERDTVDPAAFFGDYAPDLADDLQFSAFYDDANADLNDFDEAEFLNFESQNDDQAN